MAKNDSGQPLAGSNGTGAHDDAAAAEKLAALLRDLDQLATYLTERGRHTYALAQRFLENARKDASTRDYDERQATMLEYQHYIWHEIAGLVNKLLVTYGEAPQAHDTGAADTNGDS